jgi:hypothetical protein
MFYTFWNTRRWTKSKNNNPKRYRPWLELFRIRQSMTNIWTTFLHLRNGYRAATLHTESQWWVHSSMFLFFFKEIIINAVFRIKQYFPQYFCKLIKVLQNRQQVAFVSEATQRQTPTLNSTSPQKLNVHIGPSIFRTVSPALFLMLNCGVRILHCCSMEPMTVPGGDDTSICFKTQDTTT